MIGDDDSSEDEEYITPSTPVGSPLSITEAVEDDRQSATPEPITDISSDVQPLPDQTINDVAGEHEQEQESESESNTETPVPMALRNSARSIKGIPLVCYGQVQIKSTIMSELE